MERSVGMRADYLRPRLDLLRARLEPGERVLAQGRAFEPYRDSFALSELISGPGCAVAVTDRRVLWVSRSDRRWMQILPYAAVRSYLELLQEACQRAGIVLDGPRPLPELVRRCQVCGSVVQLTVPLRAIPTRMPPVRHSGMTARMTTRASTEAGISRPHAITAGVVHRPKSRT